MNTIFKAVLVVIALSMVACLGDSRCNQQTVPIDAWPSDSGDSCKRKSG